MFAAGETDFVASWSQLPPRLAALASALTRLLAASDGVAEALTRHDRVALEKSNELSTALMAEVGRIADDLADDERAWLPETPIPALRDRLAVASRRNATLIEQAWAVDAALMRLILSGGRLGGERSTVSGYDATPGPAYVDRGA
jgi:hypothetical protein